MPVFIKVPRINEISWSVPLRPKLTSRLVFNNPGITLFRLFKAAVVIMSLFMVLLFITGVCEYILYILKQILNSFSGPLGTDSDH